MHDPDTHPLMRLFVRSRATVQVNYYKFLHEHAWGRHGFRFLYMFFLKPEAFDLRCHQISSLSI